MQAFADGTWDWTCPLCRGHYFGSHLQIKTYYCKTYQCTYTQPWFTDEESQKRYGPQQHLSVGMMRLAQDPPDGLSDDAA